MNTKNSNYKRLSENNKSSKSVEPNPSFSEEGINTLSTNSKKSVLRTHLLLDYIKLHQGTTPYRISKDLEINYTDTCRAIRDLEYTKAIQIKINVLDGRANKQIFIPLKEDKNG